MINLRRLRKIIFIACVGMVFTIICSCNCNNSEDIPIATSSYLPTDAPLKSDNLSDQQLIGIWHAAPSVGSGFENMFYFYKDNRFKLSYSQYDEEKRVLDISGEWTVDENELKLSVEEKTVVIGGELVESSPSATSKYRIVDGIIKKKKVDPPEVIVYSIKKVDNVIDSPYEEVLLINEEYYWKISDDPDNEDYNQQIEESEISNTDNEFDTYFNTRYGFSIKYPVFWDISDESDAGDGVFLYKTQDIDIRFYGGYILDNDAGRKEIEQAEDNGFLVEDFTTSNDQTGYKIIEEDEDRVRVKIIVYGDRIYCRLYADIPYEFYQENEMLLVDMAKSIDIGE